MVCLDGSLCDEDVSCAESKWEYGEAGRQANGRSAKGDGDPLLINYDFDIPMEERPAKQNSSEKTGQD
jgi:hypothetical protein